MSVLTAGISAMALLLSVVLVHRFTLIREDRADKRDVQREAATALTGALQSLRAVVERARLESVQPIEVSEAVSLWEGVYRKYGTLIPSPAQHARRSVASALGEYFGAVGASNIVPEAAQYELSKHSPQWWDNADSYLGYLIDWFSHWHDNPLAAPKTSTLNFDAWLARRQL